MRCSIALAAGLLALPSVASAQTFKSSAGDLKVETVVSGLSNPWALAFLPDGRMLVTERPGRSVTSMLPSGRNASAHGCDSPPTTVSTFRSPADDLKVCA